MKFIPISDSLKLSKKVGKKSRCQDGTSKKYSADLPKLNPISVLSSFEPMIAGKCS